MIWGCLALTVVYKIFLHRMNMSKRESVLSTCVVAFSFGIWFYCTNIEVYMPPLFFLISILYVCLKSTITGRDLRLLTFLYCLSILFHQANLLVTPIIVWKIWDSRKSLPFSRSFILFGFISALIVGGTYFIIGWVVEGRNNFNDFYSWLRGYTLQSNYWFPLSFGTLTRAMIGWGHAIIGGHFAFRVAPLQSIIKNLFFYHNLDDEAFLVRNLHHGAALFLFGLTIVVFLIMLFLFGRIVLNAKMLYKTHRNLLIPLLLFLAIYSTFFFFWMPENLEFWIPQTVVLWIILLGMSQQLPKVRLFTENYQFYGILGLLLLVINFWGSIKWMKDIENDSVYEKIKKVKQLASPKDVILLQDPWLLDDFLEHFTQSLVLSVPDQPAKILYTNEKVRSALSIGGKIFMFTEGNSMHSINNIHYLDSLMGSAGIQVVNLDNQLTPVKVISSLSAN